MSVFSARIAAVNVLLRCRKTPIAVIPSIHESDAPCSYLQDSKRWPTHCRLSQKTLRRKPELVRTSVELLVLLHFLPQAKRGSSVASLLWSAVPVHLFVRRIVPYFVSNPDFSDSMPSSLSHTLSFIAIANSYPHAKKRQKKIIGSNSTHTPF